VALQLPMKRRYRNAPRSQAADKYKTLGCRHGACIETSYKDVAPSIISFNIRMPDKIISLLFARVSIGLAILLASSTVFGDGVRVIYPAYESANDTRFNDLIEILHTALELTVPEFGPYELTPSIAGMNEARYLTELENEGLPSSIGHVNVVWSSTSTEKENTFLPIRIPLRKGILGYRIALINKNNQAVIDRVKTVEDLRRLVIGQGLGWGDVNLYRANGLKVSTASYASLFPMTAMGRFDLFPRGISEVFAEYAIRAKDNPNLAIEQNLLIYYPWPYYFFFNKIDNALKIRVENGIHMMMKNGSFDAIFNKYNKEAIERADFKHRRIIVLKNNMLPPSTPIEDKSLWFDPQAMVPQH
jgi:hypothetical protein